MALGVAMGFWRLGRKSIFRIVILAATRELSSAWMKKLGEGHAARPGFADVLRVPERPNRQAPQGYFEAYLPEFQQGRVQPIIFAVRTRRQARRVRRGLKTPEVIKHLERRRAVKRIEILVTSPRFLTKVKESGRWRRWAANADVVIADEAYGMRNNATAYGRLMRPSQGAKPLFRRRSWLVALSATLLSKDMRDTRDVLSALIEWGSGRRAQERVKKLGEACLEYNKTLNEALRLSSTRTGAYARAVRTLEGVVGRYMSRIPTLKNRSYETWLTHQRSYRGSAVGPVRNFPFARPDVDYEEVRPTLDNSELQKDLTGFLYAVTSDGNQPRAMTRSSSLRLTELDVTRLNGGGIGPKPDALGKWMSEHIEVLWRNDMSEPRFKVVVYCHHVATAKLLGRRSINSLAERVENGIRTAWRRLAAGEKDLFDGFYTKPRPILSDGLGKVEISPVFLKDLPRRNPTLLVAALLNARSERSAKRKVDAFIRTLKSWQPVQMDVAILRLLRRSVALRAKILELVGCERLAGRTVTVPASDKRARALLWFVFSHQRVRDVLARVPLDRTLDALTRKIGHLDMRTTGAVRLAQAVADTLEQERGVRRLLIRWNRDIQALRRAKAREELERDTGHRTSGIVEVLTGENPERRDAVSQEFLGPGNPFVLVLTNVCSMGVDLHHYCWDVVHYSPSWTPSEFEQKSGRIDRPRQRVLRRALNLGAERRSSAIRIHHLIWPFTYDERVFRRMNLRGHMSERLLSSKLARDADDQTAEAFRRLRPLSLAPKE